MRPASHRGEKQATRHPSYFSLCPSNPGSDSPRGTLDRSPPHLPLAVLHGGDGQRPAFLMPTAEADSPRAVTGRPSSPAQEAQAVGLVGPGKPGPRREFLRISHMRRDASDSPEGKTQKLERSCSRRSLRLWHRRVALRAVGLGRREGGRKKSHHLKFWRALKYQRAAQGVGYRDPGRASQPITALAHGSWLGTYLQGSRTLPEP